MWRIGSVSGKTMTLVPNGVESIDVEPGDGWQGIYRFDSVTLRTSRLVSGDPLRSTSAIDQGTTVLDINNGPPVFPLAKRSQIVVDSAITGDAVSGVAGAVTDPSAPIKLVITNTRTAATYTGNSNADGSFRINVAGQAGDTFTIAATDSHTVPLTSPAIPVSGAIVEKNSILSLTLEPSTVTGGTTMHGSVRLTAPARAAGAIVSLASSNPGVASVPATFTIAGGSVSAQFPIDTASPASSTAVQITASIGTTAADATLTVTPASSSIVDLAFTSSVVEGGTSVDGTVFLGAPAPPGGALVMLASSIPEAGVPATVFVSEGNTQQTFTITTAVFGGVEHGLVR